MNLAVYNGTIFSSLFTDQNLAPIVNQNGSAHEYDDELLSEPTTEVNGGGDEPSARDR